jgi:glycosyltransferase involved in cell wall biosynthesis
MRKPKILLLGDASSPHMSGVASELQLRGYPVAMLSSERLRAPQPVAAVDYRYLKEGSPPSKVIEIRRVVKELAPDILHSHYLTYGGMLALLAGRHPHVASIWGDDIWLDPDRSLRNRVLVRAVLNHADLLLPVSAHLGRRCLQTAPDCAPSQVFQWGVDTAFFRYDEVAGRQFRQKLGVGGGETLIFSPRALQPSYRHHLLLEAFGCLRPAGAKLLLKRSAVTPGYDDELQRRAEELGVADKILWTGNLTLEELPGAYSASDLIASLSITDGAPITVQESMACGRLVLAADTEGSRDWVKAGATGFLTALTVDAVTASMARVLALTPAEKGAYGARARQFIMDHAERRRCFDQLEAIYEGLLH